MSARAGNVVAYGDTNAFVGLFASPDHALHERALQLFRRVADGEVTIIVTSVVMAELCFVAGQVLGWTRRTTADRLTELLDAEGVLVQDLAATRAALHLFGRDRRLDFADAYLAARALTDGPAAIATFDRALASVSGIRVVNS
jgi:predicted nucleic acid-binding protein